LARAAREQNASSKLATRFRRIQNATPEKPKRIPARSTVQHSVFDPDFFMKPKNEETQKGDRWTFRDRCDTLRA
jgi:hypothetical protein